MCSFELGLVTKADEKPLIAARAARVILCRFHGELEVFGVLRINLEVFESARAQLYCLRLYSWNRLHVHVLIRTNHVGLLSSIESDK